MVEQARRERPYRKIAVRVIAGLAIFVGAPECGRWMYGGALAQQALSGFYGDPNSVVGATIIGNGQGGPAASISAFGSPGQPPAVGASINATGCPGQSVTGLRVIQTGSGTGLNVTVGGNGPATGLNVTVGTAPCN